MEMFKSWEDFSSSMKRNLVVTVGKVLMGILMVCGAAYIYNFIGVTFFPSKPASAIAS